MASRVCATLPLSRTSRPETDKKDAAGPPLGDKELGTEADTATLVVSKVGIRVYVMGTETTSNAPPCSPTCSLYTI